MVIISSVRIASRTNNNNIYDYDRHIHNIIMNDDNGASALTTHQLQVERRKSHRANQVDNKTVHF